MESDKLDVERYDLESLLRKPSLRASVSRRVSQVRRETITTPDTTCGVGCVRGRWLQSFANRTTFIVVYDVLGSFYASYVAYFYGSVTTLEKRFRFSTQSIGIIAASGDISKVLTCLVLSFLTFKVHKPRFMGFGVFLIILSILIFTAPHFLYPSGGEMVTWQGNSTENCSDPSQPPTTGTHQTDAFSVFLLTQILQGTGAGIYLTQGKIYKDENIHMQQSPSLISLLSILKALGPAFGYWLSSVSLKTHESLQKQSGEDDPDWIGAWWLGNLVIGFILLVLGFFVVLFPQTLPKAAVRRIFNRGATGGVQPPRGLTFFNDLSCFSGTFNAVGFLPYFMYLPKYVEIQYRVPSSAANLIAGSITLILASFGIVMASSVITRYRLNAKALAGWSVLVSVLSLGGLVFYTRHGCAENDEQIKKLVDGFSHECDFHLVHKTSNQTDAMNGLCHVDCHSDFVKFIMVTCLVTFLYATGPISNFWFEIRHNEQNNLRVVGLNLIKTLVFIPGPIIFGFILDKNCIMWNGGNCWLYGDNLRRMLNFTAVGFAIVGVVLDAGVWYLIRNAKLFFDDHT